MNTGMEIRLSVHTRFRPFGQMPGLLSEHPIEGVCFQSFIRIMLQINNDILKLVSLPKQVAARCAGWQSLTGSSICPIPL
jgi:hypothetical protein